MVRRVSKYATVNPRHPEAFGICDRSGFLFNRKDLVKQMQWAGDSLVWTGLWVGKPFLDVPNEQSRSPILGPDPVPIPFPRPPLMEETFWNEIADVPWEFQSFWWEEQEDSPSPQLYETVTGWGAPTQAEQALPRKEREAMLRKINFTKPGD